jgi:hypothetical protein
MRVARWQILTIVLAALLPPLTAAAGGMRAGVGRVDITPDGPIWMSGYASRKHASTGVLQRLWAKALAIEDAKGNRVLIVTTDLIGLPRAITDPVSARLEKQHGLKRSQLLFNSSHTHTGPVVRANLMTMYDLGPEDRERIDAYAAKLRAALEQVVGAALGDLSPAVIDFGSGEAGFATNRREPTPKGVRIGVNPSGPVDRSVPVIRVLAADRKLRAVLMGYACHNTTLTGEFSEISGDYAGYAQETFERKHPGSTAMFLMLCGGDQNPNPRSSLALAKEHGESLAAEVDRVMGGKLTPVAGPVRTAFEVTELQFALHTREQFEKELSGSNQSAVRRAKSMLEAYDDRRPIRRTPYPVQAVRLSPQLAIVALGGEVVVDYALRAKREFPQGNLIVAGYSNDVMCYIPSKRVLEEGGYEAVDSMIYYGQPGPFAADVEERVFAAIQRVMRRVKK